MVCAPSPDLHLPSRQQSFVLRKAVPRLLLQRSFRTIFWTQKMPFLRKTKTPPHSSWASRSETPARVPDTNAPADLSPRKGTSAILGQHGVCPDRDDNERTRPVTTPSVRSRGLSANYSPHSLSFLAPMMDRLRISATMSSYSGSPPRFFPNGHFQYLPWI